LHYFFGYKNGRIASVVISIKDDYESAVDVDHYVSEPEQPEKQIEGWKKLNQ